MLRLRIDKPGSVIEDITMTAPAPILADPPASLTAPVPGAMRDAIAEQLAGIACEAGRILRGYHGSDCPHVIKPDGSPASLADTRSEELIVAALGRAFPRHPGDRRGDLLHRAARTLVLPRRSARRHPRLPRRQRTVLRQYRPHSGRPPDRRRFGGAGARPGLGGGHHRPRGADPRGAAGRVPAGERSRGPRRRSRRPRQPPAR
ncbi:protein of unknown function [Methylorubrum extorquens]|uniref:Uncharacterized protein n=1 Tax=Methylorubrum extorquens TaxID=408 RepID=A0A2N9AV06_METEX|nr:protein of unknown function [Methylorubrum extorquens]